MQREIKFRAWSVKNKRMVYLAHSEGSSTHLQLNNHSWGIFEPDREDYCGAATFNNHFGDVLLQYTGLKDKNGKEIYEGDIIMVGDLKYQVAFKYAEWELDILSPRVYCNPAFYSHTKTSEVIGNIYENPEYLNQPQEDTNE